MYKYKPIRYLFRAFNLIVYAVVASAVYMLINKEIYISAVMDSIFGGYYIEPKRAFVISAFLLANMFLILFCKLISKKENEALVYYICDFIIRITFSIPVSFIIFYFVLYRYCGMWVRTVVLQAAAFVLLFAIADCLMRLQIRYQLGVNYFKVYDRL